MKKIFMIGVAAMMAAISVCAQNMPAGMRMEVTSVEQNNNEYELFTYKDDDGTFGYYLSMGRVIRLMEVFVDPQK